MCVCVFITGAYRDTDSRRNGTSLTVTFPNNFCRCAVLSSVIIRYDLMCCTTRYVELGCPVGCSCVQCLCRLFYVFQRFVFVFDMLPRLSSSLPLLFFFKWVRSRIQQCPLFFSKKPVRTPLRNGRTISSAREESWKLENCKTSCPEEEQACSLRTERSKTSA